MKCPFCSNIKATCLGNDCRFYVENGGCMLDQTGKLDQMNQLLAQIEINTRPAE